MPAGGEGGIGSVVVAGVRRKEDGGGDGCDSAGAEVRIEEGVADEVGAVRRSVGTRGVSGGNSRQSSWAIEVEEG